MNCPVCGDKTYILGSKADCESVYRKRKCFECEYVFYTEEYESDTSEEEYKKMMREYRKGIRVQKEIDVLRVEKK